VRHSIILKFAAVLLATVSVACAIGCGAAIVSLESAGLYVNGLEDLQAQEYQSKASDIANRTVQLYAAKNLGELPYKLRKSLFPDPAERSDAQHWSVMLQQGDQVLMEPDTSRGYDMTAQFTLTPLYPIATTRPVQNSKPDDITEPTGSPDPTTGTEVTVPAGEKAAEEELPPVEIPTGYLYRETENLWEGTSLTTYYLYYYEAPTYTVTVYMTEDVLDSSFMHMLTTAYPYRYSCIAILAVSLVVLAVCIVILCWSAGVGANGAVQPSGLNRLPLDVYVGIAGLGIVLLTVLFRQLLLWVENEGPHPGNLTILAVNVMAITLLVIGAIVIFAAQLKVKNGYWWRHSATGWCLCKLAAGIRFLFRGTKSLIGLLPLIWRWLLTAAVMGLGVLIAALWLTASHSGLSLLFLLLAIVLCIAVVCYGGYAFGVLMRGVHRMTKGDLSYQIRTKYLVGDFLDFATRLNSLSETAMIAAQRQMKSERMKTELITNVSHDIKTPLTSIINFVDLLQQPHTPQQNAEYLEVLSRQSERMKKLIEDLVDLSKVSSGNITVNLMPMDAEETVNQALGEFSDKLEAAGLSPVFRRPEKPVCILADGTLVWRVLSNLLTNAIKYAMPGTRIYVELLELDGQALLSVKNVSREQMRASAEDLMERFVQGDESRNSDGSGLGLNIARSLMEVQGGKLSLFLDGDLFKVTLFFPLAP